MYICTMVLSIQFIGLIAIEILGNVERKNKWHHNDVNNEMIFMKFKYQRHGKRMFQILFWSGIRMLRSIGRKSTQKHKGKNQTITQCPWSVRFHTVLKKILKMHQYWWKFENRYRDKLQWKYNPSTILWRCKKKTEETHFASCICCRILSLIPELVAFFSVTFRSSIAA